MVENCFEATPRDALHADCAGEAAEKCSLTPPLTQSTLDIWRCNAAEAEVWDKIATRLQDEILASSRLYDKTSRARGLQIEIEGMATEADFEALIIAQRSYRVALCKLVYGLEAPGSTKNIYASFCDLDMASSWALKLRRGDWAGAARRKYEG